MSDLKDFLITVTAIALVSVLGLDLLLHQFLLLELNPLAYFGAKLIIVFIVSLVIFSKFGFGHYQAAINGFAGATTFGIYYLLYPQVAIPTALGTQLLASYNNLVIAFYFLHILVITVTGNVASKFYEELT